MRFKILALIIISCIFLGAVNSRAESSNTASAADGPWKFEIVPYAWLAGIDGDMTLGNRTVGVDVGFSDLFDVTDIGGSLLAITRYNHWVLYTQMDYFKLDTNKLSNAPDRARVESESFIGAATFGYQFEMSETSTIDVLGGVSYLNMDNQLTIDGLGSGDNNMSLLDGIFMVRPSFRLLNWLAFNLTLAMGGGDSDVTYQIQPELDFKINKTIFARLGYRRLYYDVGSDRKGFDGAFHGMVLGLGFKF